MATATTTGMQHTIKRAKRAWAEMGYAQRRLFEIRTGIPVTGRGERVPPARTADELGSLFELEEDKLAA